MGTFARPIICIIPLSIEIAKSNLRAKAVTKAGQAKGESTSGIITDETFFLILSIQSFCSRNVEFEY